MLFYRGGEHDGFVLKSSDTTPPRDMHASVADRSAQCPSWENTFTCKSNEVSSYTIGSLAEADWIMFVKDEVGTNTHKLN